MRRLIPGIIALLVTALALPVGTGAQTVLDYVTFDGVDYLGATEGVGRPLERDDLGAEITVESGRRVYAVRGYKTSFRIAAVVGERILLYQAWHSARATTGADLYDISGRVQAIDVRRETPGQPATHGSVRAPADVEAIAAMIERAPVGPTRPRSFGAPRYWLTFWLADGTTLGRAYFPETGELTGGVALPPEFRATLDRHLAAGR
jgi:hypothetical protein